MGKIAAQLASEQARADAAEIKVAELQRENDRDRLLTSMLHKEAMKRYIETMIESRTVVTLGLIDLSNFKLINDYWGHDFGDAVLLNLEEHLNTHLRREGEGVLSLSGEISERDEEGDKGSIARMGGDEFTVALGLRIGSAEEIEENQRSSEPEEQLERLENYLRAIETKWLDGDNGVRKLLKETPLLEGRTLTLEQREAIIAGVGFALGLSFYDAGREDSTRLSGEIVTSLLRKIDENMYLDKEARRESLEAAHPAIKTVSKRSENNP